MLTVPIIFLQAKYTDSNAFHFLSRTSISLNTKIIMFWISHIGSKMKKNATPRITFLVVS